MKKTTFVIFQRLCSKLLVSIFTIFSLAFLASCINDDEVTPPSQDPVSYMSLYHLSPNASPLNILVNNGRINSRPFEYEDYSGYVRMYAKENNFKFTPTNASNTVADTTVKMAQDSLYSLFIIADTNKVETLITLDKIKFDDTENSLIRLIHASPDTPEVKVVFTKGNIATQNLAYRSITNFQEVGNGNYSFEVQDAESEEVLATVSNVDFLSQRVYTIVVKGYSEPPTGNNNNLKVEVMPSS
ncbi:hypothetical protein GCM10011506_03460 [Marivirga lumbricoides]|uniref:DUF4397 domain-containing protein n=1 Tax=Marivirga lumbricoides TaxID=1046115 RepID=A0ABQ1LFG7_9BACT|nr:hypothetical protein GCM10011506_03460 [Marivirga lumbricoides]